MEQWKSKRHEGSSQRRPRPRSKKLAPRELAIEEALTQFIRYLKDERQASPYTLDAYERDLLRFVFERDEAGKESALASVTAEDVRAHMHGLLDRRLAKATVRRALYALGSFFGWAVRWGLVPTSPVARVIVPRRERVREVRALTKRERAVLLAAVDRLAKISRYRLDAQAPTLVRLMLKTGLRRSEVLDLGWGDVDLERGELLVRYGKGRKSRRVPIEDADLIARMSRLRVARGVDGVGHPRVLAAPVFPGGQGQRMGYSTFYRFFHRILGAAELLGTGITPHSMRHTFGSVLCARGVPVPYVKDLLGHEDIGSTMIYVHSTPAALRDAVRKLAE